MKMNLRDRVEKLEACLLPKPDYRPDVYDFLIECEMSTTARSRSEAIEKYGIKSDWLNETRVD